MLLTIKMVSVLQDAWQSSDSPACIEAHGAGTWHPWKFASKTLQRQFRIRLASSRITTVQIKLPKVKFSLSAHIIKCRTEISNLERLLKIVNNDLPVLENIIIMVDCEKPAMMLQCHKCDKYNQSQSFMSFESRTIREHLASLKSEAALKHIHEVVLLQSNEQFVPKSPFVCQGPAAMNQTAVKCSVRGGKNCPRMQEKFIGIQSGVQDKKEELEAELRKTTAFCKVEKVNYEATISLLETQLREEQSNLAKATSEYNEAVEQSRLQTIEYKRLNKEYIASMCKCDSTIKSFWGEYCGLGKIRVELEKIKGHSEKELIIVDCKVSDWIPGKCSVECGGGTRTLTRSITVKPNGGAKCPPLEATEACNEQSCPVNCEVAKWGKWSECTAFCGGGVRDRKREVLTEPEYGGEPCPATSDTEECNTVACDADCVLSDWSPWKKCSKACDGGNQARHKMVETPLIGKGTCPDEEDDDRVEFADCNNHPCAPETPGAFIKCNSSVDVMLLLDGSGSLKAPGFKLVQAMAKHLVQNFASAGTPAEIASMVYSSAKNWKWRHECEGTTPQPWWPKYTKHPKDDADCGYYWTGRFGQAADEQIKAIDALTFPSKGTMTSGALSLAESEFANGRPHAEGVIVTITDGKPYFTLRTEQVAKKLKLSGYRLVFVAIGSGIQQTTMENMKKWASRPIKDNLFVVENLQDITKNTVANNIIATVCRDLIGLKKKPSKYEVTGMVEAP